MKNRTYSKKVVTALLEIIANKASPYLANDSLNRVVKKLSSFPLIPINEIDILKKQLKRVADNKSFILVAGIVQKLFLILTNR